MSGLSGLWAGLLAAWPYSQRALFVTGTYAATTGVALVSYAVLALVYWSGVFDAYKIQARPAARTAIAVLPHAHAHLPYVMFTECPVARLGDSARLPAANCAGEPGPPSSGGPVLPLPAC